MSKQSSSSIEHRCEQCQAPTESITLCDGGRIGWFCHKCDLFHPVEGVEAWTSTTETNHDDLATDDGPDGNVTDRLEGLDDITLEEYPYRVDLHVGILADPEKTPEKWAEHVKMYVENELSSLPCAAEAGVSERLMDVDTERDDDFAADGGAAEELTERIYCPEHGDLGRARSKEQAEQLMSRHSRVYACPRLSLHREPNNGGGTDDE